MRYLFTGLSKKTLPFILSLQPRSRKHTHANTNHFGLCFFFSSFFLSECTWLPCLKLKEIKPLSGYTSPAPTKIQREAFRRKRLVDLVSRRPGCSPVVVLCFVTASSKGPSFHSVVHTDQHNHSRFLVCEGTLAARPPQNAVNQTHHTGLRQFCVPPVGACLAANTKDVFSDKYQKLGYFSGQEAGSRKTGNNMEKWEWNSKGNDPAFVLRQQPLHTCFSHPLSNLTSELSLDYFFCASFLTRFSLSSSFFRGRAPERVCSSFFVLQGPANL